jgi:hypothetical protein
MKKSRVLLIAGFVFLIISTSIVYFLFYNKSHIDIKDAECKKIGSVELYQAFVRDTSTANRLYTNQIIEVTAVIEKVSQNQQKEQIVLLNSGIKEAGNINCTMEASDSDLKEKSTIRIKGICNGYMGGEVDMGIPGDVILTRCYVSH